MGNERVREHVEAVGRHLHFFGQLCTKRIVKADGNPSGGICSEPVMNFATSLMDKPGHSSIPSNEYVNKCY